MSFPLGEKSKSTDPVDCGVNGAWVEAGESSDIGGGRGGTDGGDLIGQQCVLDVGGCVKTDKRQAGEL